MVTRVIFFRNGGFKMGDLETWIRKKNMTTNDFAKLAKCSRQVIYKVKRGICIDTAISERIAILTDFSVIPKSRPKGGRGNEHFHNPRNDIYCNI